MPETIYVDGTDLRLGRMATKVAKHLINGDKVVIVNVEKIVISGTRASALSKYARWMSLRTYKNPEKVGPKQQRGPDRLVHYAIKNMLPKSPTGKEALKRLKVYIGVPDELKSAKFQQFEEAHVKNLRGPYVRLEEISKSLGWCA
ncbi:MAG: 50S ribosomal protein L13 [Candidatus Methanomethylicota archaeon]|jgi:large subunit ribosomal protein L13|uniref:Large ribosomal subunit protein uL13 n=1 Tax=Thermoproteota archaeon TaxID=2056631 RepID=A0A523BFL8_9CREN|nr:MAG: 50S ribosomal protein L13 [Candidatus Verstraetearchaeota archaeon]